MASIESNRAAGNTAKENGTIVPVKPAESQAANSPSPTITPYPQTPNPYIRTPLPAISTQQPDQQRNWQSGSVPQERLIGIPLNANPVISAQTITNIVRVPSTISGGVTFETNNQINAIQNILNLISGSNVTLTSDAHGGVTISSTASSTGTVGLPLPNTAVYFMSRALVGTSSLQTIGDQSTQATSGGTVIISSGVGATSTNGVVVPVAVGSGGGASFVGFQPVASSVPGKIFWAGRNNMYQARGSFATAGDIPNMVNWFGLTDQAPGTMRVQTPAGTPNIVAFRTDTGGNWACVVANGGSFTVVGSGVVMTAATTYFQITMNDTANTSTFSINGTVVAVISGHNPSGFGWQPVAYYASTDLTTHNVNLGYFYAQEDF